MNVFVLLAAAALAIVGIATLLAARRRTPAPVPPEPAAADADAIRHWLLAALDELDDAVVVIDRIGREVLRNRAARRRAEARTGELLAEPALAGLLRAALDGREVEEELRVFGPPRVALRLRARPIRHGDEVVGAVGFVHDVSEVHRIEAVRRDFVANVSHELKTPIGALGLLAETISGDDDPEEIRVLAGRIGSEADRLARLVDELLDLGRAEAGNPPARELHAVGELVDAAVEAVRVRAQVSGVPVVTVGDFPPVDIACDGQQVRSALVNLLDNAIKYSESGARVEVAARRCDPDRVEIVVRDQGIGIPARSLERIFERFYRVDRARSRETGGTGLGLAIVRHVAQAHGGDVAVSSIEGEGSTFVLTLPVVGGGSS